MFKVQSCWFVGWTDSIDGEPQKFVPATVPGAVQLDWAKAENWGPFWYADNWRDYGWMEDKVWVYRSKLESFVPSDGERLVFVSKGIDYHFQVRFKGSILREQEGMFAPVELELPGPIHSGDLLEVRIFPAPKSQTETPDRSQANHSCKPAVSYGWDFHPRLVPLGIWDETYLERRTGPWVTGVDLSYKMSNDLTGATLHLDLTLEGPAAHARWRLTAPDGRLTIDHEIGPVRKNHREEARLTGIQLWWPHDQGEPALYISVLELIDSTGAITQTIRERIGFRRVRLVMNEGAWKKPNTFPKSRSVPPMTLEINGRRLFCKGSNWVNPEIFPGTITPDTYRPLLTLARDANLNLLRCWGGAIINKKSFFDLCNELGIMVWQEFPLACNEYPDDPAYLKVLDHESRAIIAKLKHHPSLVLWCGGNELFNSWSRMTDQSLALRLLNRNCFDLDPDRPFIPTSPVMGAAHGHYVFRDPLTGEEAGELFQKATATAYTEFGCAGPAPVEVLRKILPEESLFPPKPGTPWETHHAFAAWIESSHLYLDIIDYYCRPSNSLEELVEKGQMLQSEGYKALFEEARRQKPYASMALNWCFNEPWPTAANNSIISWPNTPKPAYYAVAAACRNTLVSARIRKFEWKEGEVFDAELWILSDSPQAIEGGEVTASMGAANENEIELLVWKFPAITANTNCLGPRAQFVLPRWHADRVVFKVSVQGHPEWDSEYTLAYRPQFQEANKATPAAMNF